MNNGYQQQTYNGMYLLELVEVMYIYFLMPVTITIMASKVLIVTNENIAVLIIIFRFKTLNPIIYDILDTVVYLTITK